jgi:hypothetical protein
MIESITLNPTAKAAWEEIFRSCQFLRDDGQGWLASDAVITTPAVTVEPWNCGAGGDAISSMVSSVAVYDTTQVRYQLIGGTAGESYLVRIRATDNMGNKFEARMRLYVL